MIVDGERIRLLKTNSLFKGITESVLKHYLKPKYFFEAKEGEILYVSGDEATKLYLIVEGEVKIKFCETGDVKYKYLSDFFGELEILNGGIRNSSAVANTDCVLFKISSAELKQLSLSNKRIADNLQSKDEAKKEDLTDNFIPDNPSQNDQLPTIPNEDFSSSETSENIDDEVDWILPED